MAASTTLATPSASLAFSYLRAATSSSYGSPAQPGASSMSPATAALGAGGDEARARVRDRVAEPEVVDDHVAVRLQRGESSLRRAALAPPSAGCPGSWRRPPSVIRALTRAISGKVAAGGPICRPGRPGPRR